MNTIGIVHDDSDVTPTDKIRYDAGAVVNRPVQAEGEFDVLELARGHCAVVTHTGPYQDLGHVYQRIYGGWLPRSGYELRAAPAFDEYLNSPRNARPKDLVTVIHVPLE
jgi:AraC family transcriptional regulator